MPRQPKGYSDKAGYTKIAVQLTHKTFKRICAIAEKENKQFSAVLEDIVVCGLLCLDESDAEEPKEKDHADHGPNCSLR